MKTREKQNKHKLKFDYIAQLKMLGKIWKEHCKSVDQSISTIDDKYDNEVVKLKDNKFEIQYSEQKFLIDGSSNFYIEDDFKNLLNFNILKKNNKTFFESFLNLQNKEIKK